MNGVARARPGVRYVNSEGFDSCYWSKVHVVQPDVHSLVCRNVSFSGCVTISADKDDAVVPLFSKKVFSGRQSTETTYV